MRHSSRDAIVLEELMRAGASVEDLSLAIYETLRGKALPNFLPHVKLDQDGGLDAIDSVWTSQKYVWCALSFISILFNVALLLSLNWSILRSLWYNWWHALRRGAHEGLLSAQVSNMNATQQQAMLDSRADFLSDIKDAGMKTRFLEIAATIATCEVFGLFLLLLQAVRQVFLFATNGGLQKDRKSEYRAYFALDTLFRETLPVMGTFSALKLVAWVHPALLYSDYSDVVRECRCTFCCSSCRRQSAAIVLISIYFIATRALWASIAVMAFAIKLLVIAFKLQSPAYSAARVWGEVLAFLNTTVSCVLLEQRLQDRLFLFIFGGNDAEYQDDERSLRNVYRCRIVKQIWSDYWQKKGQRFKAIAFLATFDHYDLQALLIEPSEQTIAAFQRDEAYSLA